MNDYPVSTEVGFTPDEMCATIESLHESIRNRFRWTVSPPEPGSGAEAWQTLDYEIAREAIDMLVQAYGKAYIVVKSWPGEYVDANFLDMFSLPEEIWDLLLEITQAKDWNHVPRHSEEWTEGCPVCDFLL